MFKLESMLKENPDTVYYNKKYYSYTSPANRCAFFVYRDKKSGKDNLFGYSANKKEFYCDDPEVLSEIKELKEDAYYDVTNLYSNNYGGGHSALERILNRLNRFDYNREAFRGRIFEVADTEETNNPHASGPDAAGRPAASGPDVNLDIKIESTIPHGKKIIVTFWDSKKNIIIHHKNEYDKIIKFSGYDPKECFYEIGIKLYSYDELYKLEDPNVNQPKKSYEKPAVSAILPLDVVVDDKSKEFVEKRGKLHTTGAKLTPAEKDNLEKEVDRLEYEIKAINHLIKKGRHVYYTDYVKKSIDKSVDKKLHDLEKQKKDRYSLITQAEKQYGMPIAQIRQKYRGVPLDKLVKKESIYKKLLRALLG